MQFISVLWKKYSFTLLIAFTIGGMFDLRIGILALICMIAPIIVSIKKGRFWCGNICPRGNFYDRVMIKFSGKRRVPKFFRSAWFRALVTLFMLTVFTTGTIKNWGNPYGIGMVFYRLIVVTTIVGIILALFFSHRTWCSFCPMGTLAALVSRFRNKGNSSNLLKVQSSCVSCKLCAKNCPMDIAPYEYKNDAIVHHDCIQCSKCVYVCPKKSIGYEDVATSIKVENTIKDLI
jgi:ferredoxin-type protein NapH